MMETAKGSPGCRNAKVLKVRNIKVVWWASVTSTSSRICDYLEHPDFRHDADDYEDDEGCNLAHDVYYADSFYHYRKPKQRNLLATTRQKLKGPVKDMCQSTCNEDSARRIKFNHFTNLSFKEYSLLVKAGQKKELRRIHQLVEHCTRRKDNKCRVVATCDYKQSESADFLSSKGKVPGKGSRHVLHHGMKNALSNVQKKLQSFVDLQYREIMPEDYELLLLLEDSVTQKVASKVALMRLVSTKFKSSGSDHICVICREVLYVGNDVVTLPICQHIFHASCILPWLHKMSDKCPVDNLPI